MNCNVPPFSDDPGITTPCPGSTADSLPALFVCRAHLWYSRHTGDNIAMYLFDKKENKDCYVLADIPAHVRSIPIHSDELQTHPEDIYDNSQVQEDSISGAFDPLV